MISGHRGGKGPDNTLTAMKHGLSLGLKSLEIDLRLTKDNVIVILHGQLNGNIGFSDPDVGVTPEMIIRDMPSSQVLNTKVKALLPTGEE